MVGSDIKSAALEQPFRYYQFGLVHLDTRSSLITILKLFVYQRAGVSAIPELSVKENGICTRCHIVPSSNRLKLLSYWTAFSLSQ